MINYYNIFLLLILPIIFQTLNLFPFFGSLYPEGNSGITHTIDLPNFCININSLIFNLHF